MRPTAFPRGLQHQPLCPRRTARGHDSTYYRRGRSHDQAIVSHPAEPSTAHFTRPTALVRRHGVRESLWPQPRRDIPHQLVRRLGQGHGLRQQRVGRQLLQLIPTGRAQLAGVREERIVHPQIRGDRVCGEFQRAQVLPRPGDAVGGQVLAGSPADTPGRAIGLLPWEKLLSPPQPATR